MCSLPHVRGGVSYNNAMQNCELNSSPRTWGCFLHLPDCQRHQKLFPTHVGVFPVQAFQLLSDCPLPHARGGVSQGARDMAILFLSSPRPWGCFYNDDGSAKDYELFPTPVGVFLWSRCRCSRRSSLPHARGGVSSNRLVSYLDSHSSPRPWGCFQDFDFFPAPRNLFPTPVGVVPRLTTRKPNNKTLPHARGGVSFASAILTKGRLSSPRPWGCFRSWTARRRSLKLFPTPVGVFLRDFR